MRPGQQNKRGRGRGNNNNGGGGGGGNNNNNNFNRKGGNPLTRTYDSSGPDVKIRGTAQHIAEKYAQLARDAQSSGDRVIAENYLQHAEHYNRIIASAQAQMQERFQRDDRGEYNDRDGADRDGDDMDNNDNENDNDGDDVVIVQPPQSRPHQPQQSRQHQPQAQPKPVAAQAPVPAPAPQSEVIDGTGPQPEIEGIPAEVAMDEEGAGGQPRERQPRRRSTGSRPRRPRRGAEGEEAAAEGEGASAEAPVLADAASE
ncbi:DUF4167 domain-containing protein [Rhizobium brockwellii]|uniref:DUF4167 domain-containing protein n=1 Tax=Rhizobium TaxID=379 RepID=UPI000FEEE4A4|nr:DUF4167 domain-containing protein [Rhizobium leguminosarum]QND16591.1 DUF4167 domain-containing protein [Rhizobium leguminosarum bv. trifolii]RWY81660.1 DUF4167 domain-containing protein [Rhizobium leguminosarum]